MPLSMKTFPNSQLAIVRGMQKSKPTRLMPVCWPTCSGAITCLKYGNLTHRPADSDDSLTDAQHCAQTAQQSKTAYTPLWL